GDYHQPEDDAHKIEPEMLRCAGQFVLQGLVNLAEETQVNLLIDRRREYFQAGRASIANLNPQLKDSQWSVVDLKADSTEALRAEVLEQVRQLMQSAPEPEPPRTGRGGRPTSGGRRPTRSVSRGLNRMELIGSDLHLLDLVLELYAIGRVDIAADQ